MHLTRFLDFLNLHKSIIKPMSYKCLFIVLTLIINQNFSFANSQIKDTLNILFVGNSYTYFYNLPIVVNEMSKHSNSTYIKTTHSLVGGSTLENHVNQERNTKTVDYLKNNKYDFVILYHHSLATIDRGKFFETSKKIIELVKKYNSIPIFMITWAYKPSPIMQKQINKMFLDMSKKFNIKFIPSGPLFSESLKWRPDLPLADHGDIKHPSKYAVYLNGLLFYRYFTGEKTYKKIPKRITTTDKNGQKLYLLFLNEDDAKSLQQIVDNFKYPELLKL